MNRKILEEIETQAENQRDTLFPENTDRPVGRGGHTDGCPRRQLELG